MSFPSDIQAIIDKFSATAESLKDLQTRLREGLNLGEGWVREDVFSNMGQELREHCDRVAADFQGLTSDAAASVERMTSAEKELQAEKETLRSVNEKMEGLGESHNSFVIRLEAAAAREKEALEEGLRQRRQESVDKIARLEAAATAVRDAREEGLREGRQESADKIEHLNQEVQERDSQIAALHQELSAEQAEQKKFVRQSYADANTALASIGARLTRVEEVASAGPSRVETIQGSQAHKEHISLLQGRIQGLSERIDSLHIGFGRKRQMEYIFAPDPEKNDNRVRIIERVADPITPPSSGLRRAISFNRALPGIGYTPLETAVPSGSANLLGEASGSGNMPEDDTLLDQEPEQEQDQRAQLEPEEEPREELGEVPEEVKFADIWPLIDFGLWADNLGRVEPFKAEFQEAAGTKTSAEVIRQITDHVKGNRQTIPECSCFLACMRRMASKCGTRKNPIFDRARCQANHDNDGREHCVYFLAAPGNSAAQWVLHERT
jgi:hypothetical protein